MVWGGGVEGRLGWIDRVGRGGLGGVGLRREAGWEIEGFGNGEPDDGRWNRKKIPVRVRYLSCAVGMGKELWVVRGRGSLGVGMGGGGGGI